MTPPFPYAPDLTGPDSPTQPIPSSCSSRPTGCSTSTAAAPASSARPRSTPTRDRPTLALRGDAHFHVGFVAAARRRRSTAPSRHNELARASFAAHDDARGLLMCDQFDATHLHVQGRLQEALELHLRILARSADVARRPTDLYICHNSRAITRKLLGQHDYMLLDFYEALNAATACESPGPHINALTNLGGSHTDLWNLAEAQKLSEEALDLAEAAGAWTAFAVAVFNLAQIYDGLGLAAPCAAMLERIRRNEHRMPPGVLASNTSLMAIAHLCAGDLEGARAWLGPRRDGDVHPTTTARPTTPAPSAALPDGDRPPSGGAPGHPGAASPRPPASELQGSALLAHAPAAGGHRRLRDACATPPPRCATCARRRRLYETLVGRSARAGFIATQVAHETAVARDDRDRAREAQERAEVDRRRLATLNLALEERMRESQRLNDALQQKIAEAEALQEQLRDQAVRDPLTGLYNRRFLAETSVARIELARAPGHADRDRADRHRPLQADQRPARPRPRRRGAAALRGLLRDRMRRSDVICRFGGEEFLLLVDNCDDGRARRDPRRPDAPVPRDALRRRRRPDSTTARSRPASPCWTSTAPTSSRWCAWPTRACTAPRPRAARGSAADRTAYRPPRSASRGAA